MFMDPSAFEAEDIERELVDAGVEPEMKTPAEFHSGDRDDSPGARRGRTGARNDTNVPPSSGSSYGFSASVNGNTVPRAMEKDLDRQTPTYGRHSKGTARRRLFTVHPRGVLLGPGGRARTKLIQCV